MNTPLTYQFNYKTEEGLYTVLSYGSQGHLTTLLPHGKENNNMELVVKVIDNLGSATTELLIVKVSFLSIAGAHAISTRMRIVF